MKKAFGAGILVLLFAASALAADTIKLGGMFPLSGRASDLGITDKQGAELAVKEINAKGGVLGKKFELLSADSKANVQELVSLSKRYIQKDQVNFLFGVVSSAGSLAVGEVAKQEKVIFMDTVGSTDTLTKEKWNRYTFRSGTCNSQEANSLALYTAKRYPKVTKFYNIGPDYEYGRTMWDLFKAKMKETNPKATFVGEQWPKLFIPDYTSYINAILQAKPDAVFCTLWGGDLVAFIKQAKPYGVFDKMKWVIATGGDITVVKALGKDMPTGLIVDQRYYFHWPNSKRNQEFVKAYMAEYKDYPSAWAAEGYDGVYFLAEAVKKAGSLDTEKVIAALEGLTIDAPRGKSTLRKEDHQLSSDFMVGETVFEKAYPFAIVGKAEVFQASKVLYSIDEWKKAQAANK
ncbi:MAG: amino acid ABC transporter substrate-binding protein [Deltaproteobacteria bacterium]|nr:amino acid ABC transporter substrate-binding protein [Deltaproteobacteria bacterium]